MPAWAKILLTIVAIFIALLIGAGFVGYHWMMKNKDRFAAVRKEGVAFGVGKDYGRCVDAALARLHGGLTGMIDGRLFVEGCLTTAAKSPTLCAGTPPKDEIMRTATWAVEQCRQRGLGGEQGCTQVFQAVAEACQR